MLLVKDRVYALTGHKYKPLVIYNISVEDIGNPEACADIVD